MGWLCAGMVDTHTHSYTVEAVQKSERQPYGITLYAQRHAVGFCERLCDDPNTQTIITVDVRRLHWATRTTCHRVTAVDGRTVIIDVFTFSTEADTEVVRGLTSRQQSDRRVVDVQSGVGVVDVQRGVGVVEAQPPHTEACGGGGARMLASHELVSTGARRGATGAGRDGNACADLDTPLIPP